MNGLFFYIGLGLGLAVACGLRPYLPALLAGALSSSSALGVHFVPGSYRFLQAGWWLVVLTALPAAALAALLHPLGCVPAAGAVWLLLRVRSRVEAKYAGLRVLRR